MRRKVQHQPNGGSAWGQDQLAHFFHFQTHTRAPWRTRAVGSLGAGRTLFLPYEGIYNSLLILMCPTVRVSAVRRGSRHNGRGGFLLTLFSHRVAYV